MAASCTRCKGTSSRSPRSDVHPKNSRPTRTPRLEVARLRQHATANATIRGSNENTASRMEHAIRCACGPRGEPALLKYVLYTATRAYPSTRASGTLSNIFTAQSTGRGNYINRSGGAWLTTSCSSKLRYHIASTTLPCSNVAAAPTSCSASHTRTANVKECHSLAEARHRTIRVDCYFAHLARILERRSRVLLLPLLLDNTAQNSRTPP